MLLKQIANLFLKKSVWGDDSTAIQGIAIDSRAIQPADLFICLTGHTVDGHQYAEAAILKGAAALVVSRQLDLNIPQIIVNDTRHAMAVIADYWYDQPSRQLQVIGITGTNGKTTTTYLIDRIIRDYKRKTAVIGTIRMVIDDENIPMSGTTPESLQLQQAFHRMVETRTDYAIMEVSSHALVQGRVKGVHFRTAIFTNLTQDHLDYHGTMEEYAAAKSLLFSRLGNTFSQDPGKRSFAVLNADDPASASFAHAAAVETITYGIDHPADLMAKNLKLSPGGSSFTLQSFAGEVDIHLNMLGKFNVYNALAAIAAGIIEGIPLPEIAASLGAIPGVEGRVEAINAGQPFTVLVDYAHTPDGLDNVLTAVKEIAEGRIICVFGCGGDRDRTKRPIMGRLAASLADYAIVTSDNPRSEEPMSILLDIEAGITAAGFGSERYELIADRRAAIQKAVEMASDKDVVLIAGKGHEATQTIQGVVHDFDDRLVAEAAIRSLNE